MPSAYDSEEAFCRLLGHEVPFRYCRQAHSGCPGLPCRELRLCWSGRLPVEDFLLNEYSEAERQAMQRPPQPKIATLVELLERARRVSES